MVIENNKHDLINVMKQFSVSKLSQLGLRFKNKIIKLLNLLKFQQK
jgi:hypothetical protein